jgi:hypothetical protein
MAGTLDLRLMNLRVGVEDAAEVLRMNGEERSYYGIGANPAECGVRRPAASTLFAVFSVCCGMAHQR